MEAIILCKQFQRNDFQGQQTAKTYEMFWKEHRITPGDLLKLSESHKEYRFSSVETVVENGVTWVNVHDLEDAFKVKSYHPSKIAGVVRKKYIND